MALARRPKMIELRLSSLKDHTTPIIESLSDVPIPPEQLGSLSCQAAIFVYKDDTSVPIARQNIHAIAKAEGPIRAEIHCEKQAFLTCLRTWNLTATPEGAFLCIYAHAGKPGLAPRPKKDSESASEFARHIITWNELADALPRGVQYLWLLGCNTQEACSSWSPLKGPVLHRLLATSESKFWGPFIRFFASEISLDPISSDDDMRDRLNQLAPQLAPYTQYFGSDLQPA